MKDSTTKKDPYRFNLRFDESPIHEQCIGILNTKGRKIADYIADAVVFYNAYTVQYAQQMAAAVAANIPIPPLMKPHLHENTTQQTSPSNPLSEAQEGSLLDGVPSASPPISPTAIGQGDKAGTINEETLENVLSALGKWSDDE